MLLVLFPSADSRRKLLRYESHRAPREIVVFCNTRSSTALKKQEQPAKAGLVALAAVLAVQVGRTALVLLWS